MPHDKKIFRVLAAADYFEPGYRAGGAIRSVAEIINTLKPGVELTLITRDRDLGRRQPYDGLSGKWRDCANARIYYINVRRIEHWLGFWKIIRRTEYDLLYLNSIWSKLFTMPFALAMMAHAIKARAVLIAPRGELSAGALAVKALKKKLLLRQWLRVLGSLSPMWHASSSSEAADIKRAMGPCRIVISADQTALPELPMEPTESSKETLQIVYVGRIAPIKNLRMSIAALQLVDAAVDFDIYGPVDDARYWAECQREIALLPPGRTVTYRGELLPSAVRTVFSKYDVFLLPTGGENFGHVIAESLSASCPVVCSANTPWTSILSEGGGSVLLELNESRIADEVGRRARLSRADRFKDRIHAGEVYRHWRATRTEENVIDQVRPQTFI